MKITAIGAVIVLLGVIVALAPEIPHWRISGTRSTPVEAIAGTDIAPGCPRQSARIAIIGDSHVAGSRMGGAGAPFGAVLAKTLAGQVEVERYGIGGATAADGARRWQGRDLPEVGLVILAFGTNDAAPRGWLRSKTPVPTSRFKAVMTQMIEGWRAKGHQVALLAPPPGGSAAITRRLAPYRIAVGELGTSLGVAVLDPAEAFAACSAAQPVLTHDALHMNAAGHKCLGEWLAQRLCPQHR